MSKKNSNKKSVFTTIIIVAAAFLIGKFVFAPAMLSDDGNTSQKDTVTPDTKIIDIDIPRPVSTSEYESIFSERNIVPSPVIFNAAKETSAYVYVDEEGMIDDQQFNYDDDGIIELTQTLYVPVSDLDETGKAALDTAMRQEFESHEASEFCDVSYSFTNNYYVITIKVKGFDDPANFDELCNLEFIENTDLDYISMKMTERSLIDSGFIKK